MIIHSDEDEIWFNRLKVALARFDAAFPAGDYGLNEEQNVAINALNDISFEMKQSCPSYAKELEAAHKAHRKNSLHKLVELGIVSKIDYRNETGEEYEENVKIPLA